MAFKVLFNRIPVLLRYLPSRFPTDSFNFSVFSSSFRSKLAHWPIGSGRPCYIAQLTVLEAQGSRNNITHFVVPSFSNSARSAVWLPFPSRRTTWVASPGTATGRTPTPAKAYLQCVQPVGINQILPPFKLLLGWHCKASLSQAMNTAFIIICHHCSSIYVHQLVFSSARSTV